MDDMIFFHSDREVLEQVIVQTREFLREKLGLELHEGKIVLNSCEQGILFLGAYIKLWRTYIGNRTKKNMYACIASKDAEKFEAQMQSYLGLMSHFQTRRLRKNIEIYKKFA
jgi:RNA-directed DNA polymerase